MLALVGVDDCEDAGDGFAEVVTKEGNQSIIAHPGIGGARWRIKEYAHLCEL